MSSVATLTINTNPTTASSVNGDDVTSPLCRREFNICYYVTGHGLGHATRAIGIIQHMLNLGHHVAIVSAVKSDFFLSNLEHSNNLTYREIPLDTGAIQIDPITVDPLATLDVYYQRIYLRRDEIIAREVSFFKGHTYDIIITDATPLVCGIGNILGIPVVIIANFTWDYIYTEHLNLIQDSIPREKYLEYQKMIATIHTDYSYADLFIRLPMETPMTEHYQRNANKIYCAPLLCRRATTSKELLRKKHNIADGEKILVLGFGGHTNARRQIFVDSYLPDGWVCLAFGIKEAEFKNTTRFTVLPADAYLPDYINLADVVLGKIGYGTVSECLAHGTPLIYVPRANWAEEEAGVAYLNHLNAGVKLSAENFYHGQWKDAIELAEGQIGSWDTNALGADVAIPNICDRIVTFIRNHGKANAAPRRRSYSTTI